VSKKNEAAAPAPDMADTIELARVLSSDRDKLHTLVSELNRGIEALKADSLEDIRAAIDAAADAWQKLLDDVKAHPERYVRPRSVEAHGIKFGLAKGKGKLKIADEAKTIGLIKKHFPELANVLIDTTESPSKTAIQNLPAADLKKIAVEIDGVGDVAFIKPAEGAVDKLVKALVTAAVEEGQ
jgi:hypothetical protein